MQHSVKIISLKKITHDVLQIVTEKPNGYSFIPGQATDVSINKKEWKEEKRSFTFTCLPDDDHLEFTIKTYPSRNSVTSQLLKLAVNDELIVHDVFGDISYKGEGVFIAGGAGVTPFIAIFRYLQSRNETGNNKLIFANKTKADIILYDELKKLLNHNFINILSDEKTFDHSFGFITEEFLRMHIQENDKYVYLCGPPPMMDAVEIFLAYMDVPEKMIIKEAF